VVRTIATSGIMLASAMRKLVVLLVGVLLLGIAIIAAPEQHLLPAYQLAKVSRGKAVTRVVAAGTVQTSQSSR
jgi:multidrug efflux pump subunit AcrA (membrane-fusion protein)